MVQVNIRRAQVSDLSEIREIYNQAVKSRLSTCDEDEKSLEDRQKWFEQFNDSYPLFVLIDNDKVAAYGGLFRYNPRSGYRFAVENTVYVHESYQRQGYGKEMLRHVIQAAREIGYTYIEAKIFQHNPVSLKLHQEEGFTLVGVQRDIANLDGKWFSNVLLALDLRQRPQV